jgi:sulfate transport system permease protein
MAHGGTHNGRLTLGIGLAYLGLLLFLPVSALVIRGLGIPFAAFAETFSDARVLSACRLTFGLSLLAALFNAATGFAAAWALARYRFPGRGFLDAVVDLPFALPTAVAGIALTGLYAPDGWIGQLLTPLGVEVAYRPLGIFVALVFVGFPFVVRTAGPVIEALDSGLEEAASCLGASRAYTFRRVVFPAVAPALLSGTTMAFARGLGEYGSVIFIAGNLPGVSEILPLLIVARLEAYDFTGATVLAFGMLAVSFGLLLAVNLLEAWHARRFGGRQTRGGAA